MKIRRYRPEDGAILRGCYSVEKHGPKEPDFSAPDIAGAWVVLDENGTPRAGLAARRAIELVYLGDPEWETPAVRMAALKALAREAFRTLVASGFRVGFCWIEAGMRRAWPRRLHQLGMERDPRDSFRIEAEE